MYYKFNPVKDTYIYQYTPQYNYGYDPILEVGNNIIGGSSYSIRALIQFDVNDIVTKISNNTISGSAKFELRLFECITENFGYDNFWIDVHLVSKNWTEGTGSLINNTGGNGYCNWYSASYIEKWDNSGGDYLLVASASQYFQTASGDLSIDVTNLIGYLTAGLYDNYGFMVKLRSESGNFGSKNFYSKHTSTIFYPRLYAMWDDAVTQNTNNLATSSIDYVISLRNARRTYSIKEKLQLRFAILPKYPPVTYSTSSIDFMNSLVMNNLQYEITDAEGNVYIPRSDYTKCSNDANNNYFNFDFSVLDVWHSYKLCLYRATGSLLEKYYIHRFLLTD